MSDLSTCDAPVKATYMRGGTSKGVFFTPDDLPAAVRTPGAARDRFLLRVIGSPDPYGKQIDGMGGGSSSTSKVVLVSRSARGDCDVDYLFGAVSIESPVIDWSGNCGNLTAAVGPFAIARGLVDVPADGVAAVRIWQVNIGKRIIAHVPVSGGKVVEAGGFTLDGVTFPSAEIRLEFLDPGADEDGAGGAMLPTGRVLDELEVPGVGRIAATLINAGNPSIFVAARDLGLRGDETQAEVNADPELLARLETIRAHGAVAMGLAASAEDATRNRPHTPKLAFLAPPKTFIAAGGKQVPADEIDVLARIMSMGRLHHAMTGTGAVAIAAAAAIPGTVVARLARTGAGGQIRIGHASGVLAAGAEARKTDNGWHVSKVVTSRSARRLMVGEVFPAPQAPGA
ncbi:2-methylaconitate cis-trans isomerase PrpF [uncultured Castellaniella sp.]|uniref:2-methylaconitate cis-trans isomerase PrpF n=1 Tax=uncultured Castellaniella sp. TaxID=647907 RepID=UPI002609A5DF|nr:2-methylaconitate cis-trans isomerase PrpF [uncultured Castellaniella sp.]